MTLNLDAGSKGGWNEPIQRVTGKLPGAKARSGTGGS